MPINKMILTLYRQKVDSNLLILLSSSTKTKHWRKNSMPALCRCRQIKNENLLHTICKERQRTVSFSLYGKTESLTSCIIGCTDWASHQGCALKGPIGKRASTLIGILPPSLLEWNNHLLLMMMLMFTWTPKSSVSLWILYKSEMVEILL